MTQPPIQPHDPGLPHNPDQGQQVTQQQYMPQYEKPRKRFEAKHAVIIIVSIVVLGVGALVLSLSINQGKEQISQGNAQTPASTGSPAQDDSLLQVGNCLVLTGAANDAKEEKVDCSDKSKFSFEVSQVVSDSSSCPGKTASYEISSKSRSGSTRTVKAVCLIPNLHQDVCYRSSSSATVPFTVEQNCDSANIKVTKRVDQANASCGTGEEDLTYTTPPRTYCFVTPK